MLLSTCTRGRKKGKRAISNPVLKGIVGSRWAGRGAELKAGYVIGGERVCVLRNRPIEDLDEYCHGNTAL